MIKKVIENWLTSTKEREYQLPFCQVLASQGHRVLHVSSHGPGEHGKDIVTLAPDGVPCAYQLTTGDVGVTQWREYDGKLRELASIKIRHPSVERTKGWHRSYFVTNGRITADVQQKVDMINEDHATTSSPLCTIEFDELLGMFATIQGQFYPTELRDTKRFLELLLADGREPLCSEAFSVFLTGLLPLQEREVRTTKTQCTRSLASALLTCCYIGQQYMHADNHFALIDLWVVFIAHMFAVVERHDLGESYWHSTYSLASLSLHSAFAQAIEEIDNRSADVRSLVEGNGLVDFACFSDRLLMMVGYLSAYALSRRISGITDWSIPALDKLILVHNKLLFCFTDRHPYGEAAFPQILCLAHYLESTGRLREASVLVGALVRLVTVKGKRDGLPNPYYSMESCIRHHLGLSPLDEAFAQRSYHLRSLVEWMARRFWRQFIRSNWREISHVQHREFVAEEKWGYFLWRCGKGDEMARFPDQTQSWAQLRRDYGDDELPAVLLTRLEFLPLFLIVYPHRLTPRLTWKLDEIVR